MRWAIAAMTVTSGAPRSIARSALHCMICSCLRRAPLSHAAMARRSAPNAIGVAALCGFDAERGSLRLAPFVVTALEGRQKPGERDERRQQRQILGARGTRLPPARPARQDRDH